MLPGMKGTASHWAIGLRPLHTAVFNVLQFSLIHMAIDQDEEINKKSSSEGRLGTMRDVIPTNVNSQIVPTSIKNYL